ncbi:MULTISPECIES: hypothetical protein [unclassified Streptomyces]|jgi:hypothetical protein|uniref:hypothetical protein n=1 Tax=unclassified Streptomyces TaxID=2593676 RepID=UPI0007481569|nr:MULTISPECIES: hypothetical protein [unclassified Streptomyces]KUL69362.1 hypothetical protein ADL33_31060 [Streptomyces sp. NRRL WC-3604]KUL70069.1 hypothetical protein ADL34_28485 [Streptomyces sp. NRRL WC-3605]
MPSAVVSSQGAVSALRFGRVAVMGAVVLLILVAGVWGSWGSAQHVMLTKGREHGTIEVARCGADTCAGPYAPVSVGSRARASVVIEKSVAVREGETYAVVVKPGTDEVVRSGPAGVLYAWVPLGGALLLASVVAAGGLRRARLAWLLAGAGVALLTGAYVTV